jgi:hypothetical protein
VPALSPAAGMAGNHLYSSDVVDVLGGGEGNGWSGGGVCENLNVTFCSPARLLLLSTSFNNGRIGQFVSLPLTWGQIENTDRFVFIP